VNDINKFMSSYEMTKKMMKKMQSGKGRNEEYDEAVGYEKISIMLLIF